MTDAVIYVAERLGKPDDTKAHAMLREAAHTDKYLSLTKHIVELWGMTAEKFQAEKFKAVGFPQHHAAEGHALETLKYSLHDAIISRFGCPDHCHRYLFSVGAGINAVCSGQAPMTPLMASFALHCGGQRPHGVGDLGGTIELLSTIEGFDVNFRDPETGATALHYGHFSTTFARHTMELGADPSIQDNAGKSVIDLVDTKMNDKLFEDAARFWKLYKQGKLKLKRKHAGGEDDGPAAKRQKKEDKETSDAPADVPEFHTFKGATTMESGMWLHKLGGDELDEDDTGEFRSDKGETPLFSAVHEGVWQRFICLPFTINGLL